MGSWVHSRRLKISNQARNGGRRSTGETLKRFDIRRLEIASVAAIAQMV
jgi:hypothetical protein